MAAMTEGRYFSSRSRPFQLGMTTLADSVCGLLIAREHFATDEREPQIGCREH